MRKKYNDVITHIIFNFIYKQKFTMRKLKLINELYNKSIILKNSANKDKGFVTHKELILNNFYEFIKSSWKAVEGDRNFVDGWHIKAIADHLQACLEGKINYLIINVPPGHMKSTIVSIMFPAWVMAKDPSKQFLCSSYSQALSVKDSVYCRRLIESDWYRTYFPHVKIAKDSNTKLRFDIDGGGFRVASSIDGSNTGLHADFLIADDPNSATNIYSPAVREATNEWWTSTMSTRLNNAEKGCKIIIQQRLHEMDLTGHVLSQELEGVVHLRLPMEFEPNNRCSTISFDSKTIWTDPRKTEAEILWPEFFNRKAVDNLKKMLGSEIVISGQLQQRPAPAEGSFFKQEWFQLYKERSTPELLHIFQGWDTALSTDDSACKSACVTFGIYEDDYGIMNILLLSVWSGRVDYPTLSKMAYKLAKDCLNTSLDSDVRDGKRPDYILIETKANGLSLMQDMQRMNIPCIGINPKTHKNHRAIRAASLVEAGRVYLPTKPPSHSQLYRFADEFLSAAIGFPNKEYNDIIDATSLVFCFLKDKGIIETGLYVENN